MIGAILWGLWTGIVVFSARAFTLQIESADGLVATAAAAAVFAASLASIEIPWTPSTTGHVAIGAARLAFLLILVEAFAAGVGEPRSVKAAAVTAAAIGASRAFFFALRARDRAASKAHKDLLAGWLPAFKSAARDTRNPS